MRRLDPIFRTLAPGAGAIAPTPDRDPSRGTAALGYLHCGPAGGSVISSWLLDLTAQALAEDPRLDGYTGYVHDSGEGRWTVQAAAEEAVPADVLSAALYARFRSRQTHTFGEKVLSAMRMMFGGHREQKSEG